jgi:hypothetical protein
MKDDLVGIVYIPCGGSDTLSEFRPTNASGVLHSHQPRTFLKKNNIIPADKPFFYGHKVSRA